MAKKQQGEDNEQEYGKLTLREQEAKRRADAEAAENDEAYGNLILDIQSGDEGRPEYTPASKAMDEQQPQVGQYGAIDLETAGLEQSDSDKSD